MELEEVRLDRFSFFHFTEKYKGPANDSMDQALSGRIPGVVVITNSGAPEQSTQIRIRGANSIYGGNSPLYIVDGVPNTDLLTIWLLMTYNR